MLFKGAALVDSANEAGWLRGTCVMGDCYGAHNRERLENTMATLEALSTHLDSDVSLSTRNGSIGYQESGTQPLTAWLPGLSKGRKTLSL